MWPFSRRSAVLGSRAFRYERFGGIVHLERPRALVFVDRDRARRLGYRDETAWSAPINEVAGSKAASERLLDEVLSGPLEAHLQLTNRCDAAAI